MSTMMYKMSTQTQPSIRILSVDPGYERLGIAILEKNITGKEKVLYSDCFKTDKELAFSKRLLTLGNEIDRLIEKFKPTALAIETLFLTKNQKTAMLVSEARGVVLYKASEKNISVYEYSPLQIKIAVTGYGKSDKKQVEMMVKQLIDTQKEIQHDDEYDAIAIGLTHFATEKVVI